MPEEGVKLLEHDDILSFEEIVDIVKVAINFGIDKIRLTGGEPLIRNGIVTLVEKIASLDGIKDFALTTNGILLENYATLLKNAGLDRINISLDTTDPIKFSEITRGGDINKIFRGIKAAQKAGLSPIKLNCVVFESSNETNAIAVKKFGELNGLEVRFIRQMNLETGEFSIVEGGYGGNCQVCNRLRLTANGMIKPCLFDEQNFSVRDLGAKQAFINALNCKPLKGCYNKTGKFYTIGG